MSKGGSMKKARILLLVLPVILTAFKCTRHDEQLDVINISNTRGYSEHPAIAADSRGFFYVVWDEQFITCESLFIYIAIRDPSGEWSKPEKIFAPQAGQFPDIEMDQHNTIHIVWRNTDPQGWGEILYTKKRLGCAWTEPETISVYGISCLPNFTVDNAGNVHLVWFELPSYYSPPIFYAKRDANGSWSIPVEVSEGDVFARHVPQVVASSGRQVHIVWEEIKEASKPDLIMYCTKSSDNSFTQPQAIDYSDYYLDDQIDPSIAIDPNGTVHTVWHQDDDVFYTSKELNAEWHTPIRICSTETHSSLPHIAADADGSIQVVWFEAERQLGHVSMDPEHNWSEIKYYPVDIICLMEPKPAIGGNSVGVAFSATWKLEPSGKDNTEIFFIEVPMY